MKRNRTCTQLLFYGIQWLLLAHGLLVCSHLKSQNVASAEDFSGLEALFHTIEFDQAVIDSATVRLQWLEIKGNIQEDCPEIQRLRAFIAHGCARGGKSIALASLFEKEDECTPTSGLYQYFLGLVLFRDSQSKGAVSRFKRALETLDKSHEASLQSLFNLAAALNESGEVGAAIECLQELTDPDGPWKEVLDRLPTGIEEQIKINVLGMMISCRGFDEARALMSEVNRSALSPYWRTILVCNEFILFNNLKEYAKADSVWSHELRFIPSIDLPPSILLPSMGSILATESLDYVRSLRDPLLPIHTPAIHNDHHYYTLLLDPQLSESEWMSNWEILRKANAYQREKFVEYIDLFHPDSKQTGIASLKNALIAAQSKAANWQLAMLIILSVLLVVVSITAIREITKRREIAKALEKMNSKNQFDMGGGMSTHHSLALSVSSQDIVILNEALRKGYRLGEAMMIVRKLENLFPEEPSELGLNSIFTLPGGDKLSQIEATIVLLIVKGVHAKEIANQLNMSAGYVYNTRSAVRKKLNMPEEANFVTWVKNHIP